MWNFILPAAISALGSAFGSHSQGKREDRNLAYQRQRDASQLAENQRQFNESNALNRDKFKLEQDDYNQRMNSQRQTAPWRQNIIGSLMSRFGMGGGAPSGAGGTGANIPVGPPPSPTPSMAPPPMGAPPTGGTPSGGFNPDLLRQLMAQLQGGSGGVR